jgi:hypothetical protein
VGQSDERTTNEDAGWTPAQEGEMNEKEILFRSADPEEIMEYNSDIYLVLAQTPHGERYWLTSQDYRDAVRPEELIRAIGPALLGPDGYPTEEAAAYALADEDGISLDEPESWTTNS